MGALAQAGQPVPLAPDTVDHAAAARQRMAAACLVEAPDERVVGRLEEHQRVFDATLVQLVEQLLETSEVLAAADVADHGHPVDLAALAAEQVDERRHQLGRQVVDAEPPRILERVHRLGLAGPREARDDHELQRVGHGATLPSATRTPSSVSSRSFQAGSSPYEPSRPSFLMTR